MTRHTLALLALPLAFGLPTTLACSGDKGDDTSVAGDGGSASDGGSSSDGGGSSDGGAECTVAVTDTEPESGETGWYWRDRYEVTLDGATDDASFTLTSSGGTDIPLSEEWSEGGLQVVLTPGVGMTGDETYTLSIDVCGTTTDVVFQTSSYGLPLESDPSALVGNTYFFDLPGATFVQPVGVGALLATFLDVPILLGVTNATSSEIDVLGAQAERNSSDEWVQDMAQLTWDFPAGPFDESPYFSADAAEVVITYSFGGDVYEIPVYNFHIEGTFTADGSMIGGGIALGKGDTSNMGPMLGLEDKPEALCGYLGDLGLECEDCGDGSMTCITLEAWFPEAPLMPDTDLVVIE